jgi:Cytoplasmic tRNA 2-thiolation protein 2
LARGPLTRAWARERRHGGDRPTTIMPLRDQPARDLALLCHLKRLPLAPPPRSLLRRRAPPATINSLAAAFVERLQAGVPSSASTILRTASKLQVRALGPQSARVGLSGCRAVGCGPRATERARKLSGCGQRHAGGGLYLPILEVMQDEEARCSSRWRHGP